MNEPATNPRSVKTVWALKHGNILIIVGINMWYAVDTCLETKSPPILSLFRP